MQYFITCLEGVISFISPCMLPMLPVYISYFAGDTARKENVLPRALSFVLGFTVVFGALGVFAGSLGAALREHSTGVNLVCGALMILFGLSYLGIIPLNLLRGVQGEHRVSGIVSAFLFGVVYSLNLTPCVGAFLGSALMLAASTGGAMKGLLLLLCYSLGLGVPFVLSALLLGKLEETFSFIKSHYNIINTVCGAFLIVVGIATAFGWLNRLLSVFV